MAYILLGFSVACLSVCGFFLLFDQGRWLHGFARGGQDKGQGDLFKWADEVGSVNSETRAMAVDEIGGRDRVVAILETRFAPLDESESEEVNETFHSGNYTLRELEASSAALTPLKKEPSLR